MQIFACDKNVGSTFIVNKNVIALNNDGDEYTLGVTNRFRLRVTGDGPGWGCLIETVNVESGKANPEVLHISEMNLDSLDEVHTAVDSTAINSAIEQAAQSAPASESNNEIPSLYNAVKNTLLEIAGGNDEVEQVGEPPCPDCIQLETSLRPNPRPENLADRSRGSQRSNGRVPIGQLGISEKGLELIMRYEGFSASFYEDGTRLCKRSDASRVCRTGETINIPTIGYGIQIQDEGEFNDFCRDYLRNSGCDAAKREWLKVLKGGTSSSSTISSARGRQMLVDEVQKKVRAFKRNYPHIRLRQNEFDALMSLNYNARQYFQPGHNSNFNRILSTPNFNLLELASHMYDIGPYAGNFRRRFDEINLMLLGTYDPVTRSNDVAIPQSPRLRSLYKRMVNYWDENRSRRFWRTNPEYSYFINRVKNL